MVALHNRQDIRFDFSAIDAAMAYLKEGSSESLNNLISRPGAKLAYDHYRWSLYGSHLAAKDFWKEELHKILYTEEIERNIIALSRYLEAQSRSSKWLNEVLRYLPRNHFFKTSVYLILGYDNVVFGEDVALNLSNKHFHEDPREAIYYLIHELAHAGYLRYHGMPNLYRPNTWGELSRIIKVLTHLEGMGVISSTKLRTAEGGFLDNDYKVLRSKTERASRVRDYSNVLSRLENEPDRMVETPRDFEVYDELSGQPRRLWYIAGCHMAQKIETKLGIETLRELIEKGDSDFFKTYNEIDDRLLC